MGSCLSLKPGKKSVDQYWKEHVKKATTEEDLAMF
jgi:hypothetical protein